MRILAFPYKKNKDSNPYNYLLYKAIEESEADIQITEFKLFKCFGLKYDIIHIHWPELYLNSNYYLKALLFTLTFLLGLCWAKLWGKKIVWTIHNLAPHNIKYKLINKVFWSVYFRLVDGCISLSEANKLIAIRRYPFLTKLKHSVCLHGLYTDYYEDDISRSVARRKLNIPADKKTFLFLGQIKPYKNVEKLINIFTDNTSFKDCILLIAGKFESIEYKNEVSALLERTENIVLKEGFVEDRDLATYFRASDAAIFPFKNIFNSGSVLLSLSFQTPAITPFTENFDEYNKYIPGMIHQYKGSLDEKMNNEFSVKYSGEVADELKWQNIANATVIFYSKLLDKH